MSCSTGILITIRRIYGLELLLKQELKHSTGCLAGKTGTHGKGEIKFEITYHIWKNKE
jgi:hypothetical protein